MTRLVVVRGDLTTMTDDVIVNAANSSLMGGGGVDGAIHRAGGPKILDACRAIVAREGECAPGQAVMTGAGRLPARHVIHTVGPIWRASDADACDTTLASCYVESLELAAREGLRTVAFPNISTGIYGFPKARAAGVAVGAVRGWIDGNPAQLERVAFVCFDDENERLYLDLVP